MSEPDKEEWRYATYDNPHTFSREWYANGKMTGKLDLGLIEVARKHKSLARKFVSTAIEPWEAGRIKGDPLALPSTE